ncbi:MAG: tRNA uridine-5-carboxymethylaminomethyl(34) synthesis GTPase MnmE [Prevotella sp.]|nr:tRNA uridine-5-carboxymethylaminomethyl(34) synthesis GTPase MnmE [Prevotella sp.]
MNTNNENTICAIATPVGGAIAIIRISGSNAINITDEIFYTISGKKLIDAQPNTIHYGHIKDNDTTLDEVLVSIFKAPHSYTGEDSVEISCHGSKFILKQTLQLLIKHGCRQALPGEFTQRAFINGKLDLSQAEAVADLIASTNSTTHSIAMGQLRGNFSNDLEKLREQLLKLTSLLELELDFSDHEDLEFADRTQLMELTETIDTKITQLAKSFETGKAIKNGIPVAIIGKTNVGKSTLLNILVGEDKAIVSDIHGTTRDIIEDTTDINGVTFRFIDTAGIRNTTNVIEKIGIELTYKKISESTLILWIIDQMPTDNEINEMLKQCENKKLIVVNNKIDINNITNQLKEKIKNTPIIGISAQNDTNINKLRDTICEIMNIPEINENNTIVTSIRHFEALTAAHDAITRVIEGMKNQLPTDLLTIDLRICLHSLAEITGGEITPDETLSNIFKHFCIGK